MDGINVIKEVNKLHESAGTEGTIMILLIVCIVALCGLCFFFMKINNKHNRKTLEELEKVKLDQEHCLKEKAELRSTLDSSQETIKSLNSINKLNQVKLEEATVKQETMLEVFTKLAEKL